MKNHLLYFTIKVNKKPLRFYTDASFLNIDKALLQEQQRSLKHLTLQNLHNHRKTNRYLTTASAAGVQAILPCQSPSSCFYAQPANSRAEGLVQGRFSSNAGAGGEWPGQEQEIFQSPFFPLQANELAPINEKIPTQFHQLKTRVATKITLY